MITLLAILITTVSFGVILFTVWHLPSVETYRLKRNIKKGRGAAHWNQQPEFRRIRWGLDERYLDFSVDLIKQDKSDYVQTCVATTSEHPQMLKALSQVGSEKVVCGVAANPHITSEILTELYGKGNDQADFNVLAHQRCDPDLLEQEVYTHSGAREFKHTLQIGLLASNSSTPPEALMHLAVLGGEDTVLWQDNVKDLVAHNDNCPAWLKTAIMQGREKEVVVQHLFQPDEREVAEKLLEDWSSTLKELIATVKIVCQNN